MNGVRPGVVLAGRYQLIEELRSGASAIVWHAHDSVDHEAVALKFCADADDGARRLEREYQCLTTLDHPAVVRALAAHTDHHPPFIVLEFIDGQELRADMGADPRVWIPKLRPALDGLRQAHARGVAHGDLSLHNVVVGRDGRGRLLDFGSNPGQTAGDDLRALGRLLHELTTGLPLPPNGRLAPDRAVPAQLRRLIEALQGYSGGITLADVVATLDRLLSDKSVQGDNFESITPRGRQEAAAAGDSTSAAPDLKAGLRVALAVIAIAALLTAALLLPRMMGKREALSTGVAQPAESAASIRLADQRQQFDDLRAAVYAKWLQLEGMEVRSWAQLRADRAMQRLSEAERQESAYETLTALRELVAADELMQGLLDEAPAIAAFHREAGWQAYRAGDGDKAAGHFRIVLAIEPEAEGLRDALVRAQYLDQTAALRQTASAQEAAGDLDAAVITLRKALLIDDGNQEIAAEITRLQTGIADLQFERQMSLAYKAMQDARFEAARRALAQAATLRPEAPAVRDARVQLQVSQRGAAIRRLQASAAQAEAQEQWEAAIGLYSELLQLDAALVFAQQGRDRARLLASLTARTQAALETDFARDEVRRQAEALIGQIAAVQANAPALKALGEDLRIALQRSREPVTVQLHSDSQTEVTIFRVGSLGRFERQEVQLLPGRYTVLGTCDGFRDVRTELVVQPGEPPAPVTIRCEERI